VKIVIKFYRKGIVYSPIYDIIVCVSSNKKVSTWYFLEKLGYYNPIFRKTGRKEFFINFYRLGI
jgi:ribosomal protein S16